MKIGRLFLRMSLIQPDLSIAPSKWFGSAGPHPYDDIYEDHWERI